MNKLYIIRYPDPRLLERSEDCVETDLPLIKDSLSEMTRLMATLKGVGLAAIQVAIPKRFCILLSGQEVLVLINPVILPELEYDYETKNEGCLSLPGFLELVERPTEVTIAYRDIEFVQREAVLSGIEARCILHELDHMNGKLLVDQVSVMKKQMYVKKLKKRGYM
jgi:peptide deformylase